MVETAAESTSLVAPRTPDERLGVMLNLSLVRVRTIATRHLKPLSITPLELAILTDLAARKGPITQLELGILYGISNKRLLRLLTGMADRGLLERRAGSAGLYSAYLDATSLGRSLMAAGTVLVNDAYAELSEDFSDGEWRTGMAFLARLSRVRGKRLLAMSPTRAK